MPSDKVRGRLYEWFFHSDRILDELNTNSKFHTLIFTSKRAVRDDYEPVALMAKPINSPERKDCRWC